MIKQKYSTDQFILGIIFILSGFGVVVMYSASSIIAMNQFNNYQHFFVQQVKWLFVGFFLMFIMSKVNYRIFKEYAYHLLFLSWIVLVMGYFFKSPTNDASRWLFIGGRSWMTTSDLARVSLLIFTSFFIEKHKNNLNDYKFLLVRFTPYFSISLILILFQPDTSTAIMIALIIMIMLFISETDYRYLLTISFIGFIGLIYKIIITPHALARIINWNDEQKIQSLNALGSGGILGTGLGDSIIKNGFLPQSHTDFILPIIGEELGFIGILIIFTLFWLLFTNGIWVVKEAPDLFSMLLSFGIISSIIIYFLINAAYVVGFAPTTGLPIPFISYGGSHTIFTLFSIGILLNIARNSKRNTNSFYRGFTNDN